MYENRSAAYWQLIQKLLKCPSGEEQQILNAHFELLDPGLLQTIIAVAKEFDDTGNQDVVDFLIDVALQLGEFLGTDQQPTAIRKQTADILFKWGIEQYNISQFVVAFQCWQQCLIIYQAIHDRQWEAASLGNSGIAYTSIGKYKRAISYLENQLAICREITDRQGEAASLGNIGIVYKFRGEYERAIAVHEESLAICREIQYRQGEAASLGGLGNVYHSRGEYEQAIDYHKQSLAISGEIQDCQGEAVSLGSLGNVHHSLGEYEQAIKYHEQQLTICGKIKNPQGKAASLGSLGNVCHSLGEYEQAIKYHKQSLAICKEIQDKQGEAASLGGLGNAYHSLGKYKRAIAFYDKSLAIQRKIQDKQGEANSLGNIGNAYQSLGEYERAIAFQKQHLDICQKIEDRQGKATALGNLGNAYYSLKQYEQAIDFYEQSLAISREIKDRRGEATVLGNLGNAYHPLQQTKKAIENYRDCLKITKTEITITMPDLCFKAGSSLGNIGFTQGDWHLALEGYEPAFQAVEQLRKGSTTDDRRQKIIAEAISVYAKAVQCYINLKKYDKAVETADRSRSRHLADLFASKDLYPQGEIPPEVEAYYRLQQQSDRLRSSENDGMKSLAITRQPTPNGDAIIKKIEELEKEKKKVWLKIRSKDKVLAGQLQPELLYVKDMQALIPDAETAILNIYTTGEHTHIFILRQNQLPQLHTCEGQGLETLQNWLLNNWLKLYVETPTAWQNQMGKFLLELANRLQINRLISQHLNGIKELIIIPNLYLHQIPFAALPLNDVPIPQSDTAYGQARIPKRQTPCSKTESQTSPQQQPEYLSDKFRIRIVPSCQILNFCHQRGNLKPVTMGIVENATGDLVCAGYECETLAIMHQVDKNYRLQYKQATIGNYQNLINKVQVLHSSHHASADLNNSLESKLHLSDGDINLGRVFTWRFKDLAEVFLSCCETNLTLTQITDDPLSIASGFLCAGARNVVSTLWAVDDLATALFCILYYQEKKENNSRSEALRKAQFKLRNLTGDEFSRKYRQQLKTYFEWKETGENTIEIIRLQGRLKSICQKELPFVSPHYWAGFVSQGLA